MECSSLIHHITDNGYSCECGYFVSKGYILQSIGEDENKPTGHPQYAEAEGRDIIRFKVRNILERAQDEPV